MNDQRLKLCPFCGQHPELFQNRLTWVAGCAGQSCEATPHVVAPTEQEAIDAWNTRPMAFDLVEHLRRQAAFSLTTFGPGARVLGVTDHIRKELQEVIDSGGSLKEWIDLVILALDGAWRSGASAEQIVCELVAKQSKNEGRTWPDWRTANPDQAIEHDRSRDEVQA